MPSEVQTEIQAAAVKPSKKSVRSRKASEKVSRFVDIPDAVMRLVLESVESRLRHRALLETLQAGAFQWDAYIEHFREIGNRDREALVHSLILKDEAFEEQFADWLRDDFGRFGYSVDPETATPADVTVKD